MKPDMSAAAITKRLKQTSELRRLCIALGGDRLKRRLRRELLENCAAQTETPRKRRP